MDYKDFYKKLMQKTNDTLKPFGFRKNCVNFRCLYENGIAQEIEFQKSLFNIGEWHTFTVNVNVGLFPTPATKASCKGSFLQIRRHLGETLEDGLDHQFWYQVVLPESKRIKDKRLYLFCTQAPEQPSNRALWVPYFLSVRDLGSCLNLLFASHSENAAFSSAMGEKDSETIVCQVNKPYLKCLM